MECKICVCICVCSYQVEAILETWKFLTARFFSHLDASYAEVHGSIYTQL